MAKKTKTTKKTKAKKDDKFVTLNFSNLSKVVSNLEGGKENLKISQIQEVIACVGFVLFSNPLTAGTLLNVLLDAGRRKAIIRSMMGKKK